MTIGVIGAGAFGTALAITWAEAGHAVRIWGRDAAAMDLAQKTRQMARLPDAMLPDKIRCCAELEPVFETEMIAFALPAQTIRSFLQTNRGALGDKRLIACCKGIDLEKMTGPATSIAEVLPDATAAMLTGPSFAADIAKGLPTALTLACADEVASKAMQDALSTKTLRIYRTGDVIGAELGGALKNVMAIACGVTIGAGLGDSARAALVTRGFAEIQLLAEHLGADKATLAGLSGFGDLVLTCTSTQSRNFSYGVALGTGQPFAEGTTVEGAATAKSAVKLAQSLALDLPICTVVAHLIDRKTDVTMALNALMARPLKEE